MQWPLDLRVLDGCSPTGERRIEIRLQLSGETRQPSLRFIRPKALLTAHFLPTSGHQRGIAIAVQKTDHSIRVCIECIEAAHDQVENAFERASQIKQEPCCRNGPRMDKDLIEEMDEDSMPELASERMSVE